MTPEFLLDTTVLVDALLKPGSLAARNRTALSKAETALPLFAIKELEQGALGYYLYLHNKLVETGSLAGTTLALQALSRTPQRYRTATALQALGDAQKAFGELKGSDIPANRTLDEFQVEFLQAQIATLVLVGWRRRRKISKKVVCELPCYPEAGPLRDGAFLKKARGCATSPTCSLASALRHVPSADLKKLRTANKSQKTQEATRRMKSLHAFAKGTLDSGGCRGLGDAVFALLATNVVVTTNKIDHSLLCRSIGKSAATLEEFLELVSIS